MTDDRPFMQGEIEQASPTPLYDPQAVSEEARRIVSLGVRLVKSRCFLVIVSVVSGLVAGAWLAETTFWQKRRLAGRIETACGVLVTHPHKLTTSYDVVMAKFGEDSDAEQLECFARRLAAADWVESINLDFSGDQWSDGDLEFLSAAAPLRASIYISHQGQFTNEALSRHGFQHAGAEPW